LSGPFHFSRIFSNPLRFKRELGTARAPQQTPQGLSDSPGNFASGDSAGVTASRERQQVHDAKFLLPYDGDGGDDAS
jgi:hypothetical protein